jgi:hypothetical protein
MSFKEKIMGGNKIKNVLIISEAKLRLMSPLCIKAYVGNTPPQFSSDYLPKAFLAVVARFSELVIYRQLTKNLFPPFFFPFSCLII